MSSAKGFVLRANSAPGGFVQVRQALVSHAVTKLLSEAGWMDPGLVPLLITMLCRLLHIFPHRGHSLHVPIDNRLS